MCDSHGMRFRLACLGALVAACGGGNVDETEDPLTSVTARAREMQVEGVVYVERGASEGEIVEAAREQTKSLFGALMHASIGGNHRELDQIDPKTFVSRDVDVIEADGAKSPMREVKYTYLDRAVVPKEMSRRSTLPTAVLMRSLDYGNDAARDAVVKACTLNDQEARDDARGGFLWYNFDPTRATCVVAVEAESTKVKEAQRGLSANQVARAQVDRIYLPTTVRLGVDETNSRVSYPEYDKLFAGGVEAGKLKIGLLSGRLSHEHVSAALDDGYFEWLYALYVLKDEHKGFKVDKIDPSVDISSVVISGKTFSGITLDNVIRWHIFDDGYPTGATATDKKALKEEVGRRLENRWLTLSLPIDVTMRGATRRVTVEVHTLFGAENQQEPYKRGIRENDVFVYNGHSYIGQGPLDPSNFRSSDFPKSYQILFFDGCVSYNYYHEDYFALKGPGTLELITNGIEAPEQWSGYAEGRFLSELIQGKASYESLLEAAKDTDPLRVVDGELDNRYDPRANPIVITEP